MGNGTDRESSDESDSSEGKLEALKWDHDPMWLYAAFVPFSSLALDILAHVGSVSVGQNAMTA